MIRRPVTAAAVATLSVAVLTGCGVGQNAQTYQARTPYDASNASVGKMLVRNLHVEAPTDQVHGAGGSATILGTFVNQGGTADALVSAATDVAPSATIEVDGKPAAQAVVPSHGRSAAGFAIVLKGLTRELRPGTYLTVTLSFAQAGRVDVSIPVRAGDNGTADRERLHVETHP